MYEDAHLEAAYEDQVVGFWDFQERDEPYIGLGDFDSGDPLDETFDDEEEDES